MVIRRSVKRMDDMKANIILENLKTSGALPVDADIFIDVKTDILKIECCQLGISIGIRLVDIGNVLGDDLHG